jgi:hypothetical protein
MRLLPSLLAALTSLSLLAGCDGEPTESDSSDATSVVPEHTAEAQALRALLNDPATRGTCSSRAR